jgi:uncharacterized protein (DUF1330 family)
MVAYMMVDLDIHDSAGFDGYRKGVPALIAKHGGEYLVRGGEFEIIEGDWQPHRLVLFRFSYADFAALRKRTAKSVVIAVDGVA